MEKGKERGGKEGRKWELERKIGRGERKLIYILLADRQ